MSFFFEDATGKQPFDLGDTIKVTTAAGIPFRWRLHVDGLDRRVGDTFAIEHHRNFFEQNSFVVKAADIVGDDPIIFEFKTGTHGFPAGVHRFPIMQTLRTICVLEITAVARAPIEVQPTDPPAPAGHREDPPPRGRKRKGTEDGEEASPPRVEPGVWTKFGVRSLYSVMILIVLFTLACGGFSFWTGGKIVNLIAYWTRASIQAAPVTEEVIPATENPVSPPAVTPLESRLIIQPTMP
jgi:hypothetical protein